MAFMAVVPPRLVQRVLGKSGNLGSACVSGASGVSAAVEPRRQHKNNSAAGRP